MRKVLGAPSGNFRFHYLATAAVALMLGACSTSVERFASNPSDADPVYTASVSKKKPKIDADESYSGDDMITSKPLASAPLKQPAYQTYKKPVYKQVSSYKKPSFKSYDEPAADEAAVQDDAAAPVEATETPFKKKRTAAASAPVEASESGTVRVEPGMTMYSIARANGVSVKRLAATNGIRAPYTVSVGRELKIPGVAQARAPQRKMMETADAAHEMEAAPAPSSKRRVAGQHTVAGGETLFSLGRKYRVSPYAIADLNRLSHNKGLSVGQSLRIPGGGASAVVAEAQPKAKDQEKIEASEETTPVEAAPKQVAVAQDIPEADAAEPQQQVAPVAAPAAGPGMRWPVKGKVISEYGPKPNGLKNEGINIAVPEGTGIRAADGGVIAYAGNELKGYGNLVLIRHEGGWVTAYAHAKELFVKRGDIVKRGDVIAKAGQTGSVSSPQVHFEVRKGATAMDPMKFLTSSTASN
jgi:murein DD-endopeptidase MepM/ murein hydrolase activator NlpD